MRAKFIYEKFTEDSDPIKDLGIGNPFTRIKKYDIIQINDRSELNDDNIYEFMHSFFKYHLSPHLGAQYELDLAAVVYETRKYRNKLNLKLIFVNGVDNAKRIKDSILDKERTIRSFTRVEGTHTYEDWNKYFKVIKEI